MTTEEIKLQVAISCIQGVLEAKHGVVGEIVPSVAVAESLRIADEFVKQWMGKDTLKNSTIWHSMEEKPEYPCDIICVYENGNMFIFRYDENGKAYSYDTPYFDNITSGNKWCYCDDLINL